MQRELAAGQEAQQRRREALQFCIALRDCLDLWYRTLREKIDHDLDPEQIFENITKLDEHKQFEHDYETHIMRIEAAHEPLCDPLLKKAKIFHDRLLQGKLWLHEELTNDRRLKTLHVKLVMAHRRHERAGDERASEDAQRAYVEAFLQGMKSLYFGADEELGKVIAQLSEQINQPS